MLETFNRILNSVPEIPNKIPKYPSPPHTTKFLWYKDVKIKSFPKKVSLSKILDTCLSKDSCYLTIVDNFRVPEISIFERKGFLDEDAFKKASASFVKRVDRFRKRQENFNLKIEKLLSWIAEFDSHQDRIYEEVAEAREHTSACGINNGTCEACDTISDFFIDPSTAYLLSKAFNCSTEDINPLPDEDEYYSYHISSHERYAFITNILNNLY